MGLYFRKFQQQLLIKKKLFDHKFQTFSRRESKSIAEHSLAMNVILLRTSCSSSWLLKFRLIRLLTFDLLLLLFKT